MPHLTPPATVPKVPVAALLLLVLGLAGCLPSSCSRTESRALLPADSLARATAAEVPVDTMRLVWQATGLDEQRLAYPRTVRFGSAGQVYVADTQRNSVFAFGRGYGRDSTLVQEITDPAFAFPYLAGIRGDTLLVFNPEARRVDYVAGGVVVDSTALPGGDLAPEGALQYVTATDDALYYKAVAEDIDGFVLRLDDGGRVLQQTPLAPPFWRRAGLLRMWGDSLLSLCFYRPVIDVLAPGGTLDTLTLYGFDSPNLHRSRLFMIGATHQPPMLTAAAAADGDLLFVLNMRPGWIRLDVYDRAGRLQHVLIQEEAAFNQSFFPVDLDVRRDGADRYEVAVTIAQPTPMLRLYRWQRTTAPLEAAG